MTSQPKFVFSTHDKNIYMNFKLKNINEKIMISDDEIYKILCNMNQKDIKLLGLKQKNILPKILFSMFYPSYHQ